MENYENDILELWRKFLANLEVTEVGRGFDGDDDALPVDDLFHQSPPPSSDGSIFQSGDAGDAGTFPTMSSQEQVDLSEGLEFPESSQDSDLGTPLSPLEPDATAQDYPEIPQPPTPFQFPPTQPQPAAGPGEYLEIPWSDDSDAELVGFPSHGDEFGQEQDAKRQMSQWRSWDPTRQEWLSTNTDRDQLERDYRRSQLEFSHRMAADLGSDYRELLDVSYAFEQARDTLTDIHI